MDAALLVPSLAALAGLAGGSALLLERRRASAMRAWAAARGWSWVPRDDDWAQRLPGAPFGTGAARTARHVLSGVRGGRPACVFEYRFRTRAVDGEGRSTSVVSRFSVGVLRMPGFLPQVELVPAGRAARLLLGRGLELESEAFNARYRVRADDPRLAYEVLPARTMQLLLDRPPLRLRLLGADAVTWSPGGLDPDEVLDRLDTAGALLDAVPRRVWRDHGSA